MVEELGSGLVFVLLVVVPLLVSMLEACLVDRYLQGKVLDKGLVVVLVCFDCLAAR